MPHPQPDSIKVSRTRALYESGATLKDCAKIANRSTATVNNWAKRFGWTKNKVQVQTTKQVKKNIEKEKERESRVQPLLTAPSTQETSQDNAAERQIAGHRKASGSLLRKLDRFILQIGKYQKLFPSESDFTNDLPEAIKLAGRLIGDQAKVFRDTATALSKIVEVERLAYGIIDTPAFTIERVIVIPGISAPADWDTAARRHFQPIEASVETVD